MKSLFLASFLLFIFSLSFVVANAQDAVPAPAAQSAIQKATDTVNATSSKIPDSLPATAAVIIGVVSEILMRAIPTVKPKSWFLVIALFFTSVGTLFAKAGSFLNNVNDSIKEPPKAA